MKFIPVALKVVLFACIYGAFSFCQPVQAEGSGLGGIASFVRESILGTKPVPDTEKDTPSRKPVPLIEWTTEEIRWRSDHPVVRLALQSGEPYLGAMQKTQWRGFFVDYLSRLGAAAGIQIECTDSSRSSKTFSSLDHGEIDGVAIMPKSRFSYGRQMEFFDISFQLLVAVFVSDKHQGGRRSVDLSGLTLAVPEKYLTYETIRQLQKTNTVISTKENLQALRLVTTGKAAAALLDCYEGKKLLIDPGMQDIKIVDYLVADEKKEELNLNIVVRSDWSEFPAILNKAMAGIDASERSQLYSRWFGQSSNSEDQQYVAQSKTVWWLFGFGILGFLLFLLVCFIMLRLVRDESHVNKLGSRRFRVVILAGLGSYLLVIGMIGVESQNSIKSRIMLAIENDLISVLQMANDTLELWVEEKLSLLAGMAADPGVVAITSQLVKLNKTPESLQQSEIVHLCQSVLDEDAHRFLGLDYAIIDLTGSIRCADNSASLGQQLALGQQYPEAIARVNKGEPVFIPFHQLLPPSQVRQEETTGPFLAQFLAPIRNTQGDIIGILAMQSQLSGDFAHMLTLVRHDTSLESYAINQHGVMMTNSRFDAELRQAGLLAAEQRSGGILVAKDPGGDLTKGFQPKSGNEQQPLIYIAQKLLQLPSNVRSGESRSGPLPVELDLDGSKDYRGVQVFSAGQWNPFLQLGLIASIETDEAMANFIFVRKILAATLGMTLLMSTGLTLLTLSVGERIRKVLSTAKDSLDEKVRIRTIELELQKEQMKVAESHYRQILSSMDEGLIEVDMENQIVYVNGAALENLGYEEGELLGRKMHPLLHHSYADGSRNPELGCEICMTARDGQSRVIDEDLLWKKDGTYISVEYSVRPVIKDGIWAGGLVVFRDISDQLATRRQLAAREHQFQMLIESAPDPLIIADTRGVIVIVNRRAEKMFGYDRQEMLGNAVEMLLPENKRQDHYGYRRKYIENPSMVEMGKSKLEQYGVTKDGCTIPLEIGLSVIETETGILIASSLRDISERKKSEQQIRDSETRLALAAEAGGLGMWEWRIEEDSFYMSDYWRKIKCLPDGVVSYNWQRWEEGIAQEDREKVKETLQLHLDGKSERFEAEYRFYRTHDDWYWEHVSGRIIERGADGKPIRMVGYVHDITSRKIVEETLNHERERLQQILDTSPMYVGIVCDGIFRFANHRLFLRFGITTGDREDTLFVDQDQYEHLTVERGVKQVIRNRELQLYNKTGEIRDMLASFLATSFEGRDASLCWLIDVTTLKETERELRNKVDELARFRKLAVGREQRMMELKQEINTALASKNIPPKYSVH